MRFFIPVLIAILLGCTETYTVPNHTPGVVKVIDGLLMVAYGEGGLVVSQENTGEIVGQIFPPQGMNSIDDFDKDGDLIFVLDSRNRDYLAVFSLEGDNIQLVSDPVPVQGGPFNGISAVNGNLVVAGGTTFLNRFRYTAAGEIEGPISFGRDRGHPDVLLSSDGQAAFVSTDFVGGEDGFGVSSLIIGDQLQIPFISSELIISGAGFTSGVTGPVGFPIQTALLNDNLLVAHGGGLTIVELVENYSFGSSNLIDIGINGVSVHVDQNIAYIIGFQNDTPNLVTLDLSDTSNPIILSTVEIPSAGSIPTSITTGSDDVYIAAGQAGIITFQKN